MEYELARKKLNHTLWDKRTHCLNKAFPKASGVVKFSFMQCLFSHKVLFLLHNSEWLLTSRAHNVSFVDTQNFNETAIIFQQTVN